MQILIEEFKFINAVMRLLNDKLALHLRPTQGPATHFGNHSLTAVRSVLTVEPMLKIKTVNSDRGLYDVNKSHRRINNSVRTFVRSLSAINTNTHQTS